MNAVAILLATALAALPAIGIAAEPQTSDETAKGRIEQVSRHIGEMSMTMPTSPAGDAVTERLRFEPWQALEDLFRDDVVFLMRHGPTDWSKRDATDVAPDDCDNQRVMTPDGQRQMYEMGALLVANDIVPGKIIVSRWCRNQQTFEALREGMLATDAGALDGVEIETVDDLNLLLALQGAPNVTNLREVVSEWDGEDASGPLLVITHYTNINELTEFSVYEGEMLMLDPTRENRVLGYLRLRSAGPDVGHFPEEVVNASTIPTDGRSSDEAPGQDDAASETEEPSPSE